MKRCLCQQYISILYKFVHMYVHPLKILHLFSGAHVCVSSGNSCYTSFVPSSDPTCFCFFFFWQSLSLIRLSDGVPARSGWKKLDVLNGEEYHPKGADKSPQMTKIAAIHARMRTRNYQKNQIFHYLYFIFISLSHYEHSC